MSYSRGDIVVTRFPHAGGSRGKRRPAVVIQSDSYNSTVQHVVIAEITSNVAAANDPACLLIDVATLEGQATGLTQNSVIGCLFLATLHESRMSGPIGKLSPSLVKNLNDCLKTALDIS